MARKRRKYTLEFKQEAVRLVNEENMSQAQVGKDLGVDRSTIRSWCDKAARGELAGRSGTVSEAESTEEELARLRRENRILREEREILKKAAAFFAKESQ